MRVYRDCAAGSKDVRRGRATKLSVIGTSLATVIVLFFLGRYIWGNWQQIRTANVRLDLGWLIVSVAMLGVYFVGRASVWHFLTVKTGVAIPYREAVVAWLYSQLGKYVPGKVFLFLGRLYFYVKRGRSKALVLVAFVTETTATLIASLLTVLVAVALLNVGAVATYRPLLFGGLTVLIVLIHPAVLSRILRAGLRLARRPPIEWTMGAVDTYLFVLIYTANWMVFGLAFLVFINAMFDVGVRYIIYLAGSFSFASLIGMLSVFVPSGLGVREGILIFMLSQIMPVEAAIIISVSARLWFTATELATIGVVSVARHPRVWESVTSAPRDRAAEELRGVSRETDDDR